MKSDCALTSKTLAQEPWALCIYSHGPIIIPLRKSHGLCVSILINTNALRSLQRGSIGKLQLAMGSDCASILIPLRRTHGLCVFIPINTNAMRSLQRGCRIIAASHGFRLCINPNTPAQEPWALCIYTNNYKRYEVPAEGL